jgi:hypothetical protein
MKVLIFTIIFIALFVVDFAQNNKQKQEVFEVTVDCQYTFEEALSGVDIPESIKKQLALIEVEYYSYDNKLHRGQIIVNKKASKDIVEIFEFIKSTRFPVAKVIPIVKYNWSDEASMNDNNTSGFNYRKVKGYKVLSPHSYGLAIDINPLQNPHIKGKTISPLLGKYDNKAPGTILKTSKLVSEFRKRGWQWGGGWRSSKDYQHFEKKN